MRGFQKSRPLEGWCYGRGLAGQVALGEWQGRTGAGKVKVQASIPKRLSMSLVGGHQTHFFFLLSYFGEGSTYWSQLCFLRSNDNIKNSGQDVAL